MYFTLTHQYFELLRLSAEACWLSHLSGNQLKNRFTKSYESVTTDEYLKIFLLLCVSSPLWINTSFMLSIIEMQGG